MKQRAKLLVAALRSLPEPKYAGQVHSVPMQIPLGEVDYTKTQENVSENFSVLTVKAEVFTGSGGSWLDWVIEL